MANEGAYFEANPGLNGGMYEQTNISSHDSSSNNVTNGTMNDDNEENKKSLPPMEDMLQEATDLQNISFDESKFTGRLELNSDEGSSPFVGHNSGEMAGGGAYQDFPLAQGYTNGPATGANNSMVVRNETSSAKMESIKNWTISTYKCTKQIVSEKLGRRTKTVDEELERHIENIKDMQNKYSGLLKTSKQMAQSFGSFLQTQKALQDNLTELGLKSPELQDEFTQNAELQKVLVKNGETLLCALNFFTSNLQTLSTKTIEDTLMTVKQYELCRVEYDAYRVDLEATEAAGNASSATEEARRQFSSQRQRYDKIRDDLNVKLKFLEENKVKVMRKQLLLLHNAMAAYFAGNKKELESMVKEFHIRTKNNQGDNSSFLEH